MLSLVQGECFVCILGSDLSREERMVITVAEIIQELLKAHEEGKDVNLNRLKTRIASKYGMETSPRLVDIIAAVPSDYKKILLPKLRAKPIRTASGVSNYYAFFVWSALVLDDV